MFCLYFVFVVVIFLVYSTPEELYSMFDMSEMAFNPSIPVPKKVQVSNKVKRHAFVDSEFRQKCFKRLKCTNGTYFMHI